MDAYVDVDVDVVLVVAVVVAVGVGGDLGVCVHIPQWLGPNQPPDKALVPGG